MLATHCEVAVPTKGLEAKYKRHAVISEMGNELTTDVFACEIIVAYPQ